VRRCVHVYIDSRWVEAVGQAMQMEQDMLMAALDPRPDSRLSCQVEIPGNLDGLVVRLPKSQF
jgi:ferredoxin, 2Fe-2S